MKKQENVFRSTMDVLNKLRYRHLAKRPKIFGIGLSRTGTKSLTHALERLGYRCFHFPIFLLELRDGSYSFNPEEAKYYDALTDTPVAAFYRELDARFPGSKFILTTRDVGSWLESCRKFFRPGRWQNGPDRVNALHEILYGGTEFDSEQFALVYEKHVRGVHDYFRGRESDLLELAITAGEGFEKLCPFVGKPALDEPFPVTHVSKK